MSAFVHLPNPTRISRYMRPVAADGCIYRPLKSKFGIEFAPIVSHAEDMNSVIMPAARVISGKDAGTTVSTVAPNQRVSLLVGQIRPYKYQAIICVNPAFNAVATVQHPTIVEPNELTGLDLVITAHKEVDLAEFDWYARVYCIE